MFVTVWSVPNNHERRDFAVISKIKRQNGWTLPSCYVCASYEVLVNALRQKAACVPGTGHEPIAVCLTGVQKGCSLCTEAKCCLSPISYGTSPSLPRQVGTSTQQPSIRPGPEPVNIPTTQFHIIHCSVIFPLSSWSSKGTLSKTSFYKNSILTSCFLRHRYPMWIFKSKCTHFVSSGGGVA